MTEEAMDAAEPGFDDLDCIDRDGVITMDEAATYGTSNGVPWREVKPIFDVMDLNKDHKITRKEFDDAHPVSHAVFQDFEAGFKDLDLDSDGLISDYEWMSYCNGWMTKKAQAGTCKDIFKAADVDSPHGQIDRREFDTAGPRCSTVDDGHCSMLLAIATKPTHHRGYALLLRGSRATSAPTLFRGAQLLGALRRLNHLRRPVMSVSERHREAL
jgi:Ca2+-binding EF-hand superfamily protein